MDIFQLNSTIKFGAEYGHYLIPHIRVELPCLNIDLEKTFREFDLCLLQQLLKTSGFYYNELFNKYEQYINISIQSLYKNMSLMNLILVKLLREILLNNNKDIKIECLPSTLDRFKYFVLFVADLRKQRENFAKDASLAAAAAASA